MPLPGVFSSDDTNTVTEVVVSGDARVSFTEDALSILEGPVKDLSYHSAVTVALRKKVIGLTKEGAGFGVGRVLPEVLDVLRDVEITDGLSYFQFISDNAFPGLLEGCPEDEEDVRRVLSCYFYFLSLGACYVEIPSTKYVGGGGGSSHTYTKFIATTNSGIASEWLSADPSGECSYTPPKSLYPKLDSSFSLMSSLTGDSLTLGVPYTKLDIDKEKGTRKLVNPRNLLDLGAKGVRVVPLFLLKAAVDTLYKAAQSDYVGVKYIKDSKEVKEACLTFNKDLVAEVYGTEIAEGALDSSYSGDFLSMPSLTRGFFRFPSVGESKYGDITRSLSFARIKSIEYGVTPDTSFVDVDVDAIIPTFMSVIVESEESGDTKTISAISKGLKDFGVSRFAIPSDAFSIEQWVGNETILKGTAFKRDLAQFMLANPHLFKGYTGAGVDVQYASGSAGLL